MTKEIIVGLVLSCGAYVAGDAPAGFWEMNDAAGAQLKEISVSGQQGVNWDYATSDVADGVGNFVLKGAGGAYTRYYPGRQQFTDLSISPLTRGTYRLELNLSSWSIDPATQGSGDVVALGVNNSKGRNIAGINFIPEKYEVLFTCAGGPYKGASIDLTQSSARSFAIEFDLDYGRVKYVVDGEAMHTGPMTGNDIKEIAFSKIGRWDTEATSIHIDSMGLTRIESSITSLGFALF